ncbi:MAG: LPS assembly protein LptD [Desulfobacterales bacterium]|jgi:LPS-assembly protein
MTLKTATQKSESIIRRHPKPDGWRWISRAALPIFIALGIMAGWHMIAPADLTAQVNEDQIKDVIRDPNRPWQLEADEVNYDQRLEKYNARGNVLIHKGNIKLMADFVRFDHNDMKAYAEGNVLLTNGKDILSGTSMEMDLENQIGSVENGYLFLKENNFHLTGDLIKKVGENTYSIDEASLTTCDGENPDWRITGKKVKIKEDGEGTARHATIWARKVPVLYTPYFYYPAMSKRQTGFLIPEGGTSDRWGLNYNQPFFWAIDESSDATFYGQYMNKRGLRAGAEYRYYLDDWSKGTWMVDGFDDQKIDDGIGDASKKWGFEDGNDDILRKNEDRYWLRGSHHQKMPWGVQAKLDVDLVSDQDYTQEFRNGHMGWNRSKHFFEEVFNRDLDDYNDPIRTNRLNFSKTWPLYSLNAQLRYDLDSTIRNSGDPDDTLQQLPILEFDGVKQRIATSPFFFNLNSQYVYYWSRDDKRTQRLDVYPRLYLPFRLKPFINIEPSVGVRETLWRPDRGPDDKKFYHRELYDTRLDLFSEVYNVFHTEGKFIEAIKHTIRPRIVHDFIPDVDQADLPNFDSTDRIDNRNLLTYSLINTLTSKTRKKGRFDISRRTDQTDVTVLDTVSDYSYNDFLRFELEQSYDINEGKDKDPDRPFSPISARLDLFPGKYVSVDADALWSVYDTQFLSHNIAANLWDLRGDKLSLEYRYTRKNTDEISLNPAQSLSVDLRVKVTDRLRLSGNYEYNFLDNTHVQTGLGLNYKSQCWSIDTRITEKTGVDNSQNYDFEIKVNLSGLGGFGI